MEVTIQLDPGKQLELFGPADSHLRLLRRSLGVQITARQSDLHISGTEVNVTRATLNALTSLRTAEDVSRQRGVKVCLVVPGQPAAAAQEVADGR